MGNEDVEKQLQELPDQAANALNVWRDATTTRETVEGRLFLKFKEERLKKGGPSGDDFIRALVRASKEREEVCRIENAAEALFYRLNERHLSNKKTASIRTAY